MAEQENHNLLIRLDERVKTLQDDFRKLNETMRNHIQRSIDDGRVRDLHINTLQEQMRHHLNEHRQERRKMHSVSGAVSAAVSFLVAVILKLLTL